MMHEGETSSLSFEKVYETLYPVLFRVAYRIAGSQEKAEDLCHEAFIKYYERNQAFPDLDQTKYWLIRVVKNLTLNYEKKKSRERKAYQRFKKSRPQFSEPADVEIIREEEKSKVQKTLQQLPYNLRTALVLKEYSELSYREIGKILGISEGNVKIRIFRARKKILELLKD